MSRTPVNSRLARLQTPSSKLKATPKASALSSHPIFKKKMLAEESDLNNAFSLPGSPGPKTPSSTKLKQRTPALNACYTPSSLYKKTTPLPRTKKSLSITPHITKNSTTNTPSEGGGGPDSSETSNLTVAVRVRPLNSVECMNRSVKNIVQVRNSEITIYGGTSADNSTGVSHSFPFDYVFSSVDSESDQETVFRGTGLPLIEKAFEGYNACLFAYGQTGSGKSYSMMGIEMDDSCDTEAGIIPRFCHELFRRIEESKHVLKAEIEVSYFEIYNEKIHDLLSVSHNGNGGVILGNDLKNKSALKIREHPIWGPYVVDLSTHPVDSYSSLKTWLDVGNSQRATAATGMNDKSSRSHSIFNVVLKLTEIEDSPNKQTRRSKISLVDLAGSERISAHNGAGAQSGERIKEGVSINKSLLTLGKVIAALAEAKKTNNFVPYRESVLTRLLKESLGGNSRTVMLATISPASIHLDETLATLRYACQARNIVNRVKKNEEPDNHDQTIRELRAEVERLLALKNDYERQKRLSASGANPPQPRKIIIETSVDESEMEALRQQLIETERELAKAQKSWMERLKEAEETKKTEMRMLKRKGLAMELSVDQKQACLVNLAADPILSGTLFYILPPGTVSIGRSRPSAFSQPDIVLEGPLVAFDHCSIENCNGQLFITPESSEFETFVNGELLLSRQEIFNGDRLVIGGSHYFRISNPQCSKNSNKVVVDFQLAYQEILQKQEEQLRKQLDQEKQAALNQIEMERMKNERNFKENMEILELEKFKYKCSREIFESEKKVLEENDKPYEYTPHKPSMLDLKLVMTQTSEESLHKVQMMVKEGTQLCRSCGLNFEFQQSQVLDEVGIFHAKVLIFDKDNKRKAEWPVARLEHWLNNVRGEDLDKDSIFESVDIDWENIDEEDDRVNESLNSSRISLNLSSMRELFCRGSNVLTPSTPASQRKKENLNKSVSIGSVQKFKNTNRLLTYDEEDDENGVHFEEFQEQTRKCISEMQRNSVKMKQLCDRFKCLNPQLSTVDKLTKALKEIDGQIEYMKTVLASSNTSPTKTPKLVRFFLD